MSSELKEVVIVRDFKAEDKNFILATFLRGLYYDNKFFNMIPKDEFMNNYKHVGESLVTNGKAQIACLKEDPEVIVGYILTSPNDQVLHWMYVKAAWRKQGIMRLLLPQSLTTFTHFTSLGLILKYKLPNIVFNPFRLT